MSSDRPEPEPTWTIRTAIADITPTRPQALFGYAARDEVATEAAAPLEANIIILPAPSGNHVVVVALDTLFAGPDLVDDLHQALGSRDLPPVDDIIAIASHTHTGASIDRSKPRLGGFDPDHLREVVERIVDAIATAFARPARPVDTVVHSTAPCRRNIRRRRKAWGFDTAQRRIRRTIWTRPSTGAVRHELDLVQLRGADGNAAVLWSWPCHPVNVAGSGLFDPDFPGVARDAIRGLFDDPEESDAEGAESAEGEEQDDG